VTLYNILDCGINLKENALN